VSLFWRYKGIRYWT